MPKPDARNFNDRYLHAVRHCETVPRSGRVLQFYGAVVESSGPEVFLGELCEIHSPLQMRSIQAEVVGFRDGKVLLMPYGNLQGVHVGSEIVAIGRSVSIKVGEHLRGRVINAFGDALDGLPMEEDGIEYPLYPAPINPMQRARITEVFHTGVKTLDAFLTIGRGQRLGLFAGSGVGKSTLMGMIARNSSSDINVIALIGERGREVRDFIEDNLGVEGLKKSVVVVASADQPALMRAHAAYSATAIAEYFRDQGLQVMLAMDSVTRFAMAQREIGLAVGEPPTSRGYTPSAFSALPKLLERAGNFQSGGSITALYTVLVEGDDFNEPISDHVRAILDGHVVLTRELANKGVFPAVDLLQSISRLLPDLIAKEQREVLTETLRLLAVYAESQDLIEIGAYEPGRSPDVDAAIKLVPLLRRCLKQSPDETSRRETVMSEVRSLLART